jgi:predicted transcriptional regulator
MSTLPTSIEAYLNDAGFSGTEILILNKLLESDALTLRELASKSGKSTGVLDQAMKKLLVKKIVIRQSINGSLKYVLHSLKSVQEWMKSDMQQKQQLMLRKYENFEAFIATIKKGKTKPEMEFFEGREGVKRAYMELLERGKVFMQYGPTRWTVEEDPLREFRAQYFRECRKRNIFTRVITHDNVLGRRFKSRDSFDFRETVLVEEHLHPFRFEKMIVGDTVACFQFDGEEENACFIRYNDLAEEERLFFELLWNQKKEQERQANEKRSETYGDSIDGKIVDSTKSTILPQLKSFFWGWKSMASFVAFALLAGTITYLLYQNNEALNFKRIQDKVLSVAATGALQFDAKDLGQLHTVADITKPEYAKTIYLLSAIRKQNDGVKYAYIMRPTNKQGIWEFVADADSLDPYAQKDLNGDGKVDEEDHLSPPGEKYDGMKDVPSAYDALLRPVMLQNVDQWGHMITGWAPIKNTSGSTVAILGIDKFKSDVNGLTDQTFYPIYYFFIIFFIFILIRLAAFNRSLFKEICELIRIRKMMIIVITAGLAALIMTFGLYEYAQQVTLQRMQDKVLAIASTAAPQFDANDINALQVKDDWHRPEWNKIENQLIKIRKETKDVFYVYIFRKMKTDSNKMEFVGDADSINPLANTDNDPTNDVDMNHDGKIDGSPTGGDYETWPSQPYPTVPKEGFDAYNGPTTTSRFYTDQWGTFVSGYAPIKDQNGNVTGIFAVDMNGTLQSSLTAEVFAPIYAFIIFFVIFILFRVTGFSGSLFHQLLKVLGKRIVLLTIAFVITACIGLVFAVYEYTLYLMEQEIGTRLMSFAETAVPMFNVTDLDLHIAADMKKIHIKNFSIN